jgi:hypothetical protein
LYSSELLTWCHFLVATNRSCWKFRNQIKFNSESQAGNRVALLPKVD